MTKTEGWVTPGKRARSIQYLISCAVAIAWIFYLIYLLTTDPAPQLGDWANPPHLTSSILLAIALSAVISPFATNNSLLGWWTIVASTLCIIAFECLQLLAPGRAFQFIDIALGIAGAAMAAMIGVAMAGTVLLVSPAYLHFEDLPDEISCAQPVNPTINWETVPVLTFTPEQNQGENNFVSSSIGKLCLFNHMSASTAKHTQYELAPTKVIDQNLKLNGAGIVSAPLTGLREALSQSGQITFGIRFKADNLLAGRPPRHIASLQSYDTPPAIIARIIQNGPNSSVSFSFQPWQGSSTVLANRLTDRFHEVVLTYDGTVQTTYFDGTPIGTETTKIEALEAAGSDLMLNIGKRVDRRWQPFFGEIEAIVISSSTINADKVAALFNNHADD